MDVRCGQFIGNEREYCQEFLGIRYARAGRYEYPVPVWSEEKQDARAYGASCTQSRIWYEHLEIPERAFYHREFRNGQVYRYSEDCLFLNVFKPKTQGKYPNEEGLPIWTRGGMKELRIDDGFHMCYPDIETILKNTLRPDPV